MRYFLIALAAVAPFAVHAEPRTRMISAWESTDASTFALAVFDAPSALERLPMTLSAPAAAGGTPGALSGIFDAEASTDLPNVALDEITEAEAEPIAMPFKTMKLPPLANSWLLGLARPAVLLPEPFSYGVLSIGLLGFIISRFCRTP